MAKPSRTSPRSTSKQHAKGTSGASKQTGSTFLGIVLGLIVGLAIAVVVALYITRAPTPFVAKVAPSGASDAGTIQQQYDPNRSLQGKSPGQPVPQAAQQTPPPNTAPGQSSAQPAPAPAQAPGMLQEPQIVEVPSANGASNTTAGNAQAQPQVQTQAQPNANAPGQEKKPPQVANVAPAAPNANNAAHPNSSAAPGANDANTGYFLQVGAYKTAADAEQQRARLAFQGFESKVSQRDAGGVTYFRVRIGPFSKFDDMNATRQRLSDAGIDTAVIRFTKQ
ncbi:SPOR domain-containing protein [Trinickia dinghuensis]|uniref:Cell division protein n=1 Tax=Trinickia dinghuensis TaxID=2291023 RepID=A0A3D8K577_9BURK|nr:SPOR domain-containing protein [Trinickia dinghuensis]RDV00183.1 cell division protein [Trinickia dinghuensis]